ncbi:hypothetical protein [Zavarzinella formosa]|uniref:hypothetical protein n=1 Tax=Zavarzinella formosa TaxID=360055 RepID=UPI0002FA50A2|nr:hypothetical protein [Zavarzinella formosa]
MAVTITDPELLAQLESEQIVNFKDSCGRIIGRFLRLRGRNQQRFVVSFTADEVAELLRNRLEGESPADVLLHLEAMS